MKRLLIIAAASSLLTLNIYSNYEELVEAITKSYPDKLQQLLTQTFLTDKQKDECIKLADQISRNRLENLDRYKIYPGDGFSFLGHYALTCAVLMGIPYLFDSNSQLPLIGKRPFNYKYATLNISLIPISFLFYYLAYKKNNKPGWRNREAEYLDAFKVKQILNKLSDKKEAL